MRCLSVAICAALLSLEAGAQTVSVGAVGGVSLTEDYIRGTTSLPGLLPFTTPQEFTRSVVTEPGSHGASLGVKLELQLPRRLSVEMNVLHRNYRASSTIRFDPPIIWGDGSTISASPPTRYSRSVWEVPLVAKYGLPTLSRANPFLEAGLSLRPLDYLEGVNRTGVVAGGGVQLRWRGLVFEPTARYTHRLKEYQPYLGSPKQSQIELLLGVGRQIGSAWESGTNRRYAVGVLGGFGLLNDFADKDGQPGSRSKLVGTMLEFRLPSPFWSLEMDALYHPLILSEMQQATVLTWELPVLAKYRVPARRARPFVEAGPNFRFSGNTNDTSPSHFGLTGGAGVETRWGKVKVSPTLRYTLRTPDGPAINKGASTRNQVTLLLGLSF